jgi:hypothetical protein
MHACVYVCARFQWNIKKIIIISSFIAAVAAFVQRN